LQTKVVSSPIALPSRSTAQRKPVFALPVPAVHAEASQDSFNNVDTTSQASGDISSAVSRADETHKAGVAHSVTTDDGSVPDTSGPETSAAPQEAPQPYATAQVSIFGFTGSLMLLCCSGCTALQQFLKQPGHCMTRCITRAYQPVQV